MANLFIGIVKEKLTGATVHEHFSTNSDNIFYVEIESSLVKGIEKIVGQQT